VLQSATIASNRTVGLYVDPHVDPPAHAIVLSVDEKSQTHALDGAQLGQRRNPVAAAR
jgi:hypothetical protein